MQLARKIVLTLGVWAVLIIAGLETIGVVRELRATEADMQHDHKMLGETLGAAVGRAWVLEGPAAALDLLKGVNRSQQEVQVRFVWVDAPLPDGPLVLFSKEDREELIREKWLSLNLARPGPDLRVSYTPVLADGRLGALEISQSLGLQQALVTRTAISALVAFALLGALYMLMSVLLGDRLVGRPIEKLVAFSRKLGEGDLSARVELGDTRDELATLGRALGDMAQDLGRARQRAEAELTKRLEIAEHLRHADRLATVGKLAAGVAHELGTPLNVVGARAKMIATGEVEADEARDSARIIGQQVTAMT